MNKHERISNKGIYVPTYNEYATYLNQLLINNFTHDKHDTMMMEQNI